jgi:threonine dehydratase
MEGFVSIRPSLDEISAARERLRGVAVRTPLLPLHSYEQESDILIKPENLQPIGSFKLRGIFNAVAARSPEQRAKGLLTTSSGNTAQALAWSARYFGTTARSLMPETAPVAKVQAIEAYGGIPVLVPGVEVFRFMSEHGWEQEPYTFIHPWTEMAGAGTIGLEILEDRPDVETIFVPVGGGGLIGGIGSAVKALNPSVRIVGVEPEGCCALYTSRRAGKPMQVECRTFCDGVAVPLVIPEVFEVLQEVVDDVILVPDSAARSAVKRLALRNKLVAEGSGGLGLAGALATPADQRGVSVCILTGGSIDPSLLAEIIMDPDA